MTLGGGQKISLVTGICIERDAISNIVMTQRDTLVEAGFDVQIFAQHADRTAPTDLVQISDPWALQLDRHFAQSDLVIYHLGIQYELFNSLVVSHPRARRVVHFHNITPPELLDGPPRHAALAGISQVSLVVNADRIWSDSNHNITTLIEHADVDVARIRVLEPGLAFEPDVPLRSEHPRERICILAVGRFVRAKGLLDLLDAIERLDADVLPSVQVRLAGSTSHADAGYLAQVATRAEALGVELLRDLDDRALAALYDSSDIFVSASHHEGFCVPVIEALAAGCRVIATDAGALPDTVGGCGTIVPAGDVAAMAKAITAEVRSLRALTGDDAAIDLERSRIEHTRQHLDHFGAAATRRRLLHEVRSALALDPPRVERPGSVAPGAGGALTATERFARHQLRLRECLACPTCHHRPDISSAVWVSDAVESGGLVCPDHGLVGVISAFTPSFLERELQRARLDGERMYAVLDLERDVTCLGRWTSVPQGALCLGESGDALVFDAPGDRAQITFFGHDHSGIVRVLVEGRDPIELDLHRADAQPVELVLDDLGPGRRRVHLVPGGASSAGPHATQMVVARVEVEGRAADRRVPAITALNRGNPYPERFAQLLGAMPDDAMVLDCGGGDRRYGDDRVYNLEYLEFELPDLFGDGLCLPFADDSFDLIMSQAVLEHVPDPQRAVDELIRVLKPGGQVYIEIAFMQPLHAVPSHYMNVTPHGIAHLCRGLEVLDAGTFGGLAVTFEWIAQLADAEARLGAERLGTVLETLRDLDRQLSPQELDQFASAVYLLGRKRPR